MQVYYVYEPQLSARGWPDDAGLATPSWFDKDLAEPTAEPALFVNFSTVYAPSVSYQVFSPFFVNQNIFFSPRAHYVKEPDILLKNEVRRIMMLRRKPPPEI